MRSVSISSRETGVFVTTRIPFDEAYAAIMAFLDSTTLDDTFFDEKNVRRIRDSA